MAWRFHGHARVNAKSPEAFAICDSCGFLYNHVDLSWQYEYAGPVLQNQRLLVCRRCNDLPNPQLKPRILPPDPTPIYNARPEAYDIDDSNWLSTQGGLHLITQSGVNLVTQNNPPPNS